VADLPRVDDLSWVRLAAEHVPAWHRLLEAVVEADDGDEHLTLEDLHDELAPQWLDLARDSVLALDPGGRARAFGIVLVRPGEADERRVHLWGAVDPAWRGRGIGRELLRWQLDRAAERRADAPPGVPVRAYGGAQDRETATVRLYERTGFERVRYFSVMRRPLDRALPDVEPVPGVRYVPYTDALSEPLRLAHNIAFADHWGSQPWTVQDWRLWVVENRWFRPEWTVVAVHEAGHEDDHPRIAGYAMSAGYEPDWAAQGFSEGWTSRVGVLPPWRGRGLGRALLVESMRRFAADGLAAAGLDVDADNTTGAVALYTGLGYEVVRRSATWRRELPCPPDVAEPAAARTRVRSCSR
jgi:mycothiol synthase